MNGGGDPD